METRRRRRACAGVAAGLIAGLVLAAPPAAAGEASVESVDITRMRDGTYRFDVTVRHADEGTEHYADKWVVETRDGKLLGERTLHHPHVDEQPFTRALTGVEIPDHVNLVVVRAHDSVHGWGGASTTILVPD